MPFYTDFATKHSRLLLTILSFLTKMGIIIGIEDPFTRHWWTSSPGFLACVVGLYLGFHAGYEAPEQTVEWIRDATLWKNLALAIINGLLYTLFTIPLNELEYDWACEKVRHRSYVPEDDFITQLSFVYLLCKILEMSDSIVMVTRGGAAGGKISRVSVICHHTVMVVFAWFGMVFLPGGTTAILERINCGYHFIMYSLLFATSKSQYLRENLWTFYVANDIAQFIQILLTCFGVLIGNLTLDPTCEYPGTPCGVLFVYVLLLFAQMIKILTD